MTIEPTTRKTILDAAKAALIEVGYAGLSTRKISEMAGVPLSQIHYHFGSKRGLMLEVLAEENRRLLHRQTSMYSQDMPLWKQWEQACDFLEDDMDSGYVRVLQEMAGAGFSDPEIADAVKVMIGAWFGLLSQVAAGAEERLGGIGSFTPEEAAVIAGAPFLGVETLWLLGFTEKELPTRSALRKVGEILRELEAR